MRILRAEQLKKSYGEKQLLDDVSFLIKEKERIGLIGVNGTGKTTLMSLLAGKETADAGTISHQHDYTIGYLPQHVDFKEDVTVLEAVFQGDSPIIQAVKRYETAVEKLAVHGDDPVVQQEYQRAEEEMTKEDAWLVDTSAKTILSKLGILHLSKAVGEMSGGQKKRLGLAQVLIQEPDLLLLDEPTNHLDYRTIQWLEKYLTDFKGALVVITHDRYFLDQVATRIFELSYGKLYEYTGNYQSFLAAKAEREETESRQSHKRKQLFKQELAWMRAGVQARGTKQQARIDRFHELKKGLAPVKKQDSLEITTAQQRLGKKVLLIEDGFYDIDGQSILRQFNLLIQSNERLGITGDNGTGKSTLLNILAGRLALTSGTLETGETVRIGYYTQENEQLEEDKRVIQYLQEQAEEVAQKDGTTVSVADMLERFLFPRHTHGTLIRKLSGGEKRRLYLLKILIQQPNVLLLDEPTNDLDIETLTILEDYIQQFQGAVVTVSHDRYFLDKTVSKLLLFKGNGIVDTYYGSMSDYLSETDEEKQTETATASPAAAHAPRAASAKKEKQKLTYMEQKEWETIENDIDELEQAVQQLEDSMLAHAEDAEKLLSLQQELTETEAQLEHKMARWEYLSAFVEL
ncbi:ABC-F family ATP-binding cassette domain-containing protein [Vagococcus acidifermentans]|uniref:Multidrug ABC transporter ATP-binding protein n=1 Tax=Vagococcus acidifermentans TaxID=564710 RepID=A0A430AXY7_9ENTE|nr:ABC-F family ATP-binding cassette domain-containing protein [Vagococcus acidifermentans]RSU12932.1 multidrug ABC transporter ATP-binding protein [Vagococcus acidifermentans]